MPSDINCIIFGFLSNSELYGLVSKPICHSLDYKVVMKAVRLYSNTMYWTQETRHITLNMFIKFQPQHLTALKSTMPKPENMLEHVLYCAAARHLIITVAAARAFLSSQLQQPAPSCRHNEQIEISDNIRLLAIQWQHAISVEINLKLFLAMFL